MSPALLITTSKWPASRSATLKLSPNDSVSLSSRRTGWKRGNEGNRLVSRDVPQTSSPRSVSNLAVANPIPALAPVMKIRFISRSPGQKCFPAALMKPGGAIDQQENHGGNNLTCHPVDQNPASDRGN